MKKSTIFYVSIVSVLLGISIYGLFENSATQFINGVLANNLEFLAAVEEVKLIMAGIHSINLPFVSGHSGTILSSLNKAESFLLVTNVITFLQVMIISLSKSWILKGILVVLFGLSFVKKLKKITTKFLLIGLALSPGLSMYTVAVKELSTRSSIDYGDKYLTELRLTVAKAKSDKAELMQEHAKQLVEINNGEKAISPLRKFVESVAFDVKKVKTEIRGSYAGIRLLLHDAGYEMTSKLIGFGSMVLFSLLILPIGYALLMYLLYRYLFRDTTLNKLLVQLSTQAAALPSIIPTTKPSIAVEETTSTPAPQSETEPIQNKITNEFEEVVSKIHGSAIDHTSTVKNDFIAFLDNEKKQYNDKIEQLKNSFSTELAKHYTDIATHLENEKNEIAKAKASLMQAPKKVYPSDGKETPIITI
jgi:hypothetical protein